MLKEKNFIFRISEKEKATLKAEAKKRKTTMSDILRLSIQALTVK